MATQSVVIVGGGFAGLNCAQRLGGDERFTVTLIDKQNHHLFQPLLYQVAMAGLSPADIAVPIRRLLADHKNISVLMGQVSRIDPNTKTVHFDKDGTLDYDYLVLACGSTHSYFGNDHFQPLAPGLKTLSQATEIRRRVLAALEDAEKCADPALRKALLTFVVVGGGPTGVELAGALGEMTRHTLNKEFRHIDPGQARILLIEGSDRILSSFHPSLSERAQRDLEQIGVQVWTESRVTDISAKGVSVGEEHIHAHTIVWAAGVQASPLGKESGLPVDRAGRVIVGADLSVEGHGEIFVVGDMATIKDYPLPGVAPTAIQQGDFVAKQIVQDAKGESRGNFAYIDRGQMATIGRSRAVMETGNFRLTGFMAWMAWVVVHIYQLVGFRNRVFVVAHWVWSYVNFRKGARLIVDKNWQMSD